VQWSSHEVFWRPRLNPPVDLVANELDESSRGPCFPSAWIAHSWPAQHAITPLESRAPRSPPNSFARRLRVHSQHRERGTSTRSTYLAAAISASFHSASSSRHRLPVASRSRGSNVRSSRQLSSRAHVASSVRPPRPLLSRLVAVHPRASRHLRSQGCCMDRGYAAGGASPARRRGRVGARLPVLSAPLAGRGAAGARLQTRPGRKADRHQRWRSSRIERVEGLPRR
jgi:hypothetical protein